MPASQARSGRRPEITLPSRLTVPASGASAPAIMLKIVVLPAPLGPIRAWMAPAGTLKLTSCTARRPRKLLPMPASSSRAPLTSRRSARPSFAGQPRPHAGRPVHHDHQQRQAVEDLLDAGNAQRLAEVGEGLAQSRQHDGADDGSEQRAQAADDRRQGDLDRAADGEGRLGKEVVVVEGVPHAGQRRQRRRDHDRDHLAAQHRHADRLCRLGILADGEPVAAEPAFEQGAAEDEGEGGERQDHVIEEQRPAAQVHDIAAVASTLRNSPPAPPAHSQLSKARRVNSLKAMVSRAK